MGRAVHHFIRDLTQNCAQVSVKRGKTGHCMNYKLTKEHVREAIFTNPKFAFLKLIVQDIALPEDKPIIITKDENQKVLGKRRHTDEYQVQEKNEEGNSMEGSDYQYTGGLSYMQGNKKTKVEDEDEN